VNTSTFTSLSEQCLYLAFILALPTIAATAAIGLILAIVQAITQIQEQTLAFAFKLAATVLILTMTAHWMASQLVLYTSTLLDLLPTIRSIPG
jgi:type III secretion protein S